jgi:hypothetical protein
MAGTFANGDTPRHPISVYLVIARSVSAEAIQSFFLREDWIASLRSQ